MLRPYEGSSRVSLRLRVLQIVPTAQSARQELPAQDWN